MPINIVTLYIYASGAYENFEAAQAAQTQNPGHGDIAKIEIETPAFEPNNAPFPGGKWFSVRQIS